MVDQWAQCLHDDVLSEHLCRLGQHRLRRRHGGCDDQPDVWRGSDAGWFFCRQPLEGDGY